MARSRDHSITALAAGGLPWILGSGVPKKPFQPQRGCARARRWRNPVGVEKQIFMGSRTQGSGEAPRPWAGGRSPLGAKARLTARVVRSAFRESGESGEILCPPPHLGYTFGNGGGPEK